MKEYQYMLLHAILCFSSSASFLPYRVIADKQIPVACLMFGQQKRELLHEKGLVPNFMSHMVNLFEFGLLTPAVLKKGMQVVLGLEEAGVS